MMTLTDPKKSEVAKALLMMAPTPSSKETKALLSKIPTLSLADIYERVLKLNKYTNKELLHYLQIVKDFPCDGICIEDLINLKFASQDKYTSQLVLVYFKIVNMHYQQLSFSQRMEIFYRYIYLFTIYNEHVLYSEFISFIKHDLIDFFVFKKYYLNFPFLKEFIVDYFLQTSSSKGLAEIGYLVPPYRNVVYQLLEDGNWMLQRWDVNAKYSIPAKFFLFDCKFYMEDLALKEFESVGNIHRCIFSDIHFFNEENQKDEAYNKNCRFCTENDVEDCLSKKKAFISIVKNFNSTSALPEGFKVELLRITPLTDLKVLGGFLCKEKNVEFLTKFAESFNLYRTDLLESLRIFLSSFYLLGESQIIDRVLSVFTQAYLNQNKLPDSQYDPHKQVFYSFIVLNTMLFNTSIEKKPSFEDYLKLMGHTSDFFLSRDTMKDFYYSIKNNEIKLPTSWDDTYDKYLLYLDAKSDQSYFKAASCENHSSQVIIMDDSKAANEDNIEVKESIDIPTCKNCVIIAYRMLFLRSYNNYFFLEPDEFFDICKILNLQEVYENYIRANKNNVGKCLAAFRNHIEIYQGSQELYSIFMQVLEKTKKSSVFSDIKSILKGSSSNAVLPPFVNLVESIFNLKFASQELCAANLKLLYQDNTPFFRQVVNSIISSNSALIEDISYMDSNAINSLLDENIEKFKNKVSPNDLVKYIKARIASNGMEENIFDIFCDIQLYNKDTFEIFCFYLHYKEIFDNYTSIVLSDQNKSSENGIGKDLENNSTRSDISKDLENINLNSNTGKDLENNSNTGKDLGNNINVGRDLGNNINTGKDCEKNSNTGKDLENNSNKDLGSNRFIIKEKFEDQLKDPENILKLYSSSNSILNIKKVMKIHRDSCPLVDPFFLDFKKVVYLIHKCNPNDTPLLNYTLYVMNYLSDSLILLTDIYEYIYFMFSYIDEPLRRSLIKLYIRRLKVFTNNKVACCKDEPIDKAKVDGIVNRFLNDKYLEEVDFYNEPSSTVKAKEDVMDL